MICVKEYSSRQNLWKHNNKFHTSDINNDVTSVTNKSTQIQLAPPIISTENNPNVNNSNVNNNSIQLLCKICKKNFKFNQSKWRHEKICKVKNENKLKEENEKLKLENEQLKKEKEKDNEFKKEFELIKKQIAEIMNKQNKIHPKTLTKINKQLNNNSNNTTINNNIIALGFESIHKLFNTNQQLDVLNKKYLCLDYLVKQVHFNDKYPQFKTILITNTQNNIAYKYNKSDNKFIAIEKDRLIDEVITERMSDIESFYDNHSKLLDDKTSTIIQKFINNMDNKNGKYYDDKMKDIKLVIYNNRDKVTKEISQDLEIIV
jgi:hypothetical protein